VSTTVPQSPATTTTIRAATAVDGAGGNATGNDADTYGWDTAFAISFTHANNAITANWPNVSDGAKNVNQSASDDPTFTITGVLGPWQLTDGGDGKNVRMACLFTSGTYTAEAQSFPLDGVKVVIEIGMEWVPDPGQFAFVIGGNTEVDGIKADLDANTVDAALQAAFSAQGHPLSSAATALVQNAGVEWLITDGSTNYYIFHSSDKYNDEFLNVYQFEKAWLSNLKALATAASNDEPAVSIITIVNDPVSGVAAAVLSQLLSTWFNANIGEFNHVFASLDLSPVVSSTDPAYAWMRPTASSYAVTDQGTLDSSVFGALTMALDNDPSANHQVSPYAIPTGCDAGFLISGPNFMQHMLLAGAQEIFGGAPASSFTITNDGLTVTNTEDLVWGTFMMDNKQRGSVPNDGYSSQLDARNLSSELVNALASIAVPAQGYSVSVTTAGSQWLISQGSSEYILNLDGSNIDVYEATVVNIAGGQFSISLIHTYVQIQFINLLYSYSSDFDVHINYTENVQLGLQPQGDRQIFWFDQIMKNMVVNVTKTNSAITRQIVEGAITAAISLLAIAGPIIEGLQAGAEIGTVTEDAGEAVIDAEAFAEVEAANPQEAAADEAAAGEAAGESSGGKMTNIKNAFNTPHWKVVGWLAALSGAFAGFDTTVQAICQQAAQNQWQNVPGFDDFANFAIAPYTWPNVPKFTLESASLAGSLQVGLTIAQQ
jgi:hypothetical protein